MKHTKYQNGDIVKSVDKHDRKFDHWEDNDAKDICTQCKKMWTRKNAKLAGGGCFEGDTKIILEDYSEKMIKDIQIGDKVLAYNEEKHYFET
jgi:hypothetical protein